ncbi:hypothetical protein WMY93_003453 [Mugilogobius chulae]|uniref:Ig-like domain-containing protein n=1 Tax=Mugilogobius chulae TaxID=88201 RepID=A0AAW0PZX1_9GOBI
MLWSLLTLISALTCVSAVTTVTQTPDVLTVRRGEMASMDCNLGTVDNHAASWYKQLPESSPIHVVSYGWGFSAKYGPGFSAPKFNSTHQSKSDYRLVINNVDEADSAFYHCKTWDNSTKATVVFGQGTKLIVTDILPAPVLTVFPPSHTQLQSSRASLLCVSRQRGPFAQVVWLVDGTPVNSEVWSSTAVQQPDQSFYMSSSLFINSCDWHGSKVFTCQVSVGGHSSEKQFTRVASEIPQICDVIVFGLHTSLFQHAVEPALTTALTCASAVTTVTQSPDVVTVRRGETATMNCNLGTVTDSSARWYRLIPGAAPKYVLKYHHSFSNVEYGPGFSAPKFTSTHQSQTGYRLIINIVDEADSAFYHCTTWDDSVKEHVSHTVVFGQGTKLIVTDILPAPVLTVFPPSHTQLQSSRASLLCVSRQRGPFAQVVWLVDGTPVNSEVWSSSAVQQPDQSFYMSSSLFINSCDWHGSKVFTCRVSVGGHSSEKQFTRSPCDA